MTFAGEQPKQLHYGIIGDLRFNSKIAADEEIQNFKINSVFGYFYFDNLRLHTNFWQGFVRIPVFLVENDAYSNGSATSYGLSQYLQGGP